MKNNFKVLIILITVTTLASCFCLSDLYFNPPTIFPIVGENYFRAPPELFRVYKFEILPGSSDQQIVKIMTEKYLEQYQVDPIDWYDWLGLDKINSPFTVDDRIWSFKINTIEIQNDDGYGKSVVENFEVLPVVRDSWFNILGDYVTEMDNGWSQIWWELLFQDKGFYYVFEGPYSGG